MHLAHNPYSSGAIHHGILLTAVVVLIVAAPMIIRDANAITESISELLSPVGLLLLPIVLLLAIQSLSSDRGSFLNDPSVASLATIQKSHPPQIAEIKSSEFLSLTIKHQQGMLVDVDQGLNVPINDSVAE